MTIRAILIAVVCYGLSGCATFHTVPGSPAAVIQHLDADNVVQVTNRRGETLELANVRVVGDSVVGVRSVATGERFAISLDDVQSLALGTEHVLGSVVLMLAALTGALLILIAHVGFSND